MTSQAEKREALKRVLNAIMPKYLFEFNGFMMNLVDLIQKNIIYKYIYICIYYE